MSLIDRVDKLAGASGELGEPVNIPLGVIETVLATGLVEGGASVRADERDTPFRVDDHNGEVAALDDMADRLLLLLTLATDSVKVRLHH